MTAWTFTRRGPQKRSPAPESSAPAVGFAAATAVSTPIERAPRPPILTRAETVPCTCPEDCERDHEND